MPFRSAARRFAEADEALGEPLSQLIFEGPEDRLTLTENAQPAILAVSIAASRLLESHGVDAGLRRRSQPRRVLGQRRGGDLRLLRRAANGSTPRPLHAGGGAGGRGRHGGDPGPRCRQGGAGVCRGGQRRGRRSREFERRRSGGDCRGARRRQAGRRAGQGARRQARHAAAGQRALSLRPDEAGRRAPGT